MLDEASSARLNRRLRAPGQARQPGNRERVRGPAVLGPVVIAAVLLAAVGLVALAVGRFYVPLGHVVQILAAQVVPFPVEASQTEQNVVLLVRMPRVLLAVLVGGGLAIGGAALQAIFRNPLVSPEIIGVAAGASFGGALALLLGLGTFLLVAGSFAFGMVALGLLFLITSGRGGTPMLMIVLGGVVTGSFFSALVALGDLHRGSEHHLAGHCFLAARKRGHGDLRESRRRADPRAGRRRRAPAAALAAQRALPWRRGRGGAGPQTASPALGGAGWPWPSLSPARWPSAARSAGWAWWCRTWRGCGLARTTVCSCPCPSSLAAPTLSLVDTVARTLTAGEIPLGVLTALIGAPVFFVLLRRNRERIWESA